VKTDERWPFRAVREAGAAAGVSVEGAAVLRVGQCAVVALPAAGVVARVGRPGYPAERLDAELRFARYVSRAGLPALAPADGVSDRPLVTDQGPVTFWPLVHRIAGERNLEWLARTLRNLHDLPPPEGLVSLWDPVGRVEERIALHAARATARDDHVSLLVAASAKARADLARLRSTLGVRLVHGDPLNVVVAAGGPLLLDFDLAGIGPAEWDLVSVAVLQRRFGLPREELLRFCGAYGFDLSGWEDFEVLLSVRELLDCSFALAAIDADPRAEGELEVRLRAWLDPTDHSPWTSLG